MDDNTWPNFFKDVTRCSLSDHATNEIFIRTTLAGKLDKRTLLSWGKVIELEFIDGLQTNKQIMLPKVKSAFESRARQAVADFSPLLGTARYQ